MESVSRGCFFSLGGRSENILGPGVQHADRSYSRASFYFWCDGHVHHPCSFCIFKDHGRIEKLCDQAYPSNTTHVRRSNLDLLVFDLSEFSARVTIACCTCYNQYLWLFNLARAFPTGYPHVACIVMLCNINMDCMPCSSCPFSIVFSPRTKASNIHHLLQKEAPSPTEARPIKG